MVKKALLSLLPAAALICFASLARAQSAPAAQRIEQEVIINGQQVPGLMIVHNGVVQSYTCSSPQEYQAADQTSSGWACYDQSTGTWLLHAVPPQQTAVNEQASNDQAAVYYQPGSDAYPYPYYSSPYPYAYSYPYPYSYPYYPYGFYGGPAFAFGFGSGWGWGHGHFDGHSHGSFSHGGFGNGVAPHGSFGHMGGGSFGHMGGGGGHMGGGGFGHGGGHR
jgi:hypothetical protein